MVGEVVLGRKRLRFPRLRPRPPLTLALLALSASDTASLAADPCPVIMLALTRDKSQTGSWFPRRQSVGETQTMYVDGLCTADNLQRLDLDRC